MTDRAITPAVNCHGMRPYFCLTRFRTSNPIAVPKAPKATVIPVLIACS